MARYCFVKCYHSKFKLKSITITWLIADQTHIPAPNHNFHVTQNNPQNLKVITQSNCITTEQVINQQGIWRMKHLIVLTGSFTRSIAKFASDAKQMQHGHKQLNTVLPLTNERKFNYQILWNDEVIYKIRRIERNKKDEFLGRKSIENLPNDPYHSSNQR